MRDPLFATDPDRHASVHASAGTGKTWLLVTRMLRLLLAGAAPTGILAVTFTRKAAAEMLQRLDERLADLASGDDPDIDAALGAMGVVPTAALRERARGLYESLLFEPRPLRATTFHAFCQEILQRFPVEAEVPPGFELQDSEAELIDAAWDALYAEATAAPDGRLARALEQLFDAIGGLANTRQALDSFLRHRIDWWAYVRDQEQALVHARERARQLFDIDPDADPTAEFLNAARIAQLHEYATLLGRHSVQTYQQHQSLIQTAIGGSAAPADCLAQITSVLLIASGEPRKRSASKALEKSLGVAGCARLVELHNELCTALLEARERQARLASLACTNAWYEAGQRLLDHYQRIKRERRVLDFADLEWSAYRLLNGSGQAQWVQYKLDARIDHLLIDEFQDTNPTQWRLLLPLLEELAAGASERARSVFLVGDAKQSIYRFRRADARLLETASLWLEQHLGADRFGLEASRRSAPAIIDCVNRAFAEGPLAAAMGAFPEHGTHWEGLWGRVELLPPFAVPTPEEFPSRGLRNPLQTPRPFPADSLHTSEGETIAARIRTLMDAPVLIGPPDQARPLRYGDVLILLRNRTHAGTYEKALRDAGIPYLGAARGTLLDNLEVRDMEALLNTLVAPHNDLALAQLLRSPLFDARDEDLIRLAQTPGQGWMARVRHAASEAGASEPLRRAARLLPAWQDLVGRLPVHDLLDRIYHEGDVLARFEAAAPAALKPRVRASLIRFIELALEVDSGRYPSLPHFVARLEDLRTRATDAPDDAPPESGDGDRVRFLTVHGAKGLEAPVVFLADCGAEARDRNAWQALVDWPAEADRPHSFMLVGRKSARDRVTQQLLDRQSDAERREDANLLYVALTRARQLLFVSAAVDAGQADNGWYGLLRATWDQSGETRAGRPFVHVSGSMPDTARAPPTRTPPAIPVDPQLTQPITSRPALLRIAPSGSSASAVPRATGRGSVPRQRAESQDPDGRRRGIGIHRLLEWLTSAPARTRAQLLGGLAREMQRDAEDPELADWLSEAEAVIQAPNLAALFTPDNYEKTYVEVPLSYYEDDVLVDGIIDRVLVNPSEVHLIDYKTHAIATAEAANTAQAYREQLRLYAEGARRLWPNRGLRTSILFTHCRALIDLPSA